MSRTQLSYLGGSGLTPGQNTKTLSATQVRRKGRKKIEKKFFNKIFKIIKIIKKKKGATNQ